MPVFKKTFTIRYEDVDPYNRLTPSSLTRYLLDVGSAHSDSCGYGYNDIPVTHAVWIILNWKIELYQTPHYADQITICTWAKKAVRTFCYRDYEILNEKNQVIGIATSKWVLIHDQTRKIMTISQDLLAAYGLVNRSVFSDEIQKLKEPACAYTNQFDYTILRRDLDTNHHVNNSNYVDFACEALPEKIYENMNFHHMEVMYKKQTLYQEPITCLYAFENGKHYVVMKSRDLSDLHAIVVFS